MKIAPGTIIIPDTRQDAEARADAFMRGRFDYDDYLHKKRHANTEHGFDPGEIPGFLFDFQASLVEWSIRKGRAAIFADCGLGKTPMQLAWADAVARHTNGRVLILTPLAVAHQTILEGEKFGYEVTRLHEGTPPQKAGIFITNYERLHLLDRGDFAAVVADESSAIKNYGGKRRKIVTRFMQKMPYRLLCTATAAPNDYIEIGTSSEALGELGHMDMLGRFFKNDEKSLNPIWWGSKWRFKKHAERPFWRWMCSWARACRKPSDLGFEDNGFILPKLTTTETVVECSRPRDGFLFVMPAASLDEQREERRLTINERCEVVAEKVDHDDPAVAWCHLNAEGDLLAEMIPDAVQVSGKDSDDAKEEKFLAFSRGDIRVLVTKPKIGAFGLNWQHCAHMTFFPSHSYEQYYQSVRRSWRFGQKRPVTVDIITTEGESRVLKNLLRKSKAADKMFSMLVEEMSNELGITQKDEHTTTMEAPSWL